MHRHARDVLPPVQPPPADVDRGPGATGTPQGQYASGPPSARLSGGAPGRERPAPARRRARRRWAAGPRRRRRRPPRARRRPRCSTSSRGAVDAVDQPEGLHRQQRGAEGRPLVAGGEADRHAQRVGQHLAPQVAAREAAGGADLAHLVARVAHRGEHERELQADALERRAHEVPATVVAGEPDVGAARHRAPVRRALGEQVGEHEQPLAAGRHLRGQLEQLRLGVRAEVGRQRLAGPAQHGAAVVDRAADDPAPRRQRVAEDPPLGIDRGALDHQPQRAARADRAGGHAGAHRAEAEVGQRPVAGADDEREPGLEPEVGGGRRARARAGAWWARAATARRRRCPRSRAPRGPSRASRRLSSPVPEATEWSTAHVPVSRATHELLDPGPAPDGGERLGLVLGEPHELGQRRHRVQRRARPVVQLGVLGAQPLGLLGRPHVAPRHQRRERPAAARRGPRASASRR